MVPGAASNLLFNHLILQRKLFLMLIDTIKDTNTDWAQSVELVVLDL